MPATFISGERCVFVMDVTVPGFQLFEERTVLDATAADIVGEAGKQQAVRTVATIIGAEPRQIFSQYPICFRMGVLPFSVVLALLNHMAVCNGRLIQSFR